MKYHSWARNPFRYLSVNCKKTRINATGDWLKVTPDAWGTNKAVPQLCQVVAHAEVPAIEQMHLCLPGFIEQAHPDTNNDMPNMDPPMNDADTRIPGEIDESPSLCRSISASYNMLPSPAAVADFQGPWELIETSLPEGVKPQTWLKQFIITGRLCFSGDGFEEYLSVRGNDEAILLAGGVLSIAENGNVLHRMGKSGCTLKMRRFSMVSTIVAEAFQGIWELTGDGEFPPANWLNKLTISGMVWKGEGLDDGGLLKFDECGNVVLAGNVLSLGIDGELCYQFNGKCLCYQFVHSTGNPWY